MRKIISLAAIAAIVGTVTFWTIHARQVERCARAGERRRRSRPTRLWSGRAIAFRSNTGLIHSKPKPLGLAPWSIHDSRLATPYIKRHANAPHPPATRVR